MEKYGASSQDLAKGFENLKKDVLAFKEKWGKVVTTEADRIDKEDKLRTDKINEELGKLEKQLAQ